MFYREKAYTRINWKNRPNLSTPLGAKNLNKMDATLNELDDRIIEVSSEVEQNRLNIVLMSGELNTLKADVAQNTSQIEKISNLAEDVNGLKIVNTASGTTACMDDASNMNIEDITFYGESKQLQTTGKNELKFPYYGATNKVTEGVTFITNSDETITVNGTSTGDAYLDLYNNPNEMLVNEPIIFSKGAVNTVTLFYFERIDGRWNVGQNSTESQTEINITPSANATGQIFRLTVSQGKTASNVKVYPMVRFASITDDTWEPYTNGPAPNPDYPQPIESKIVNRVDVLRKNLLQNTANDIERIGLTYTMQSDGSVKVVGTTTESDYQVLIGQVTLPKGSYILSGAPNNICRLRIAKGDNSTLLGHDLGSGFSFTLEEESTVFVSVRTQSTVGTNINVVYYPMIRPSFFTDATYEPYQSQTVNLSAPIELNGIGGVRDTIEIYSDGTGKYIQRIGKVVANKNTRFSTSELSTLQRVSFTITNMLNLSGRNADVLSSHFVASIEGTIYSMFHAGTEIYLHVGVNNTTDFNSFIADKEITFYYPLAEPIETELPQADIDAIKALHTYKPNTVVMNDADAEMDVHYVADAKTYIDKKFEALASALVNQ